MSSPAVEAELTLRRLLRLLDLSRDLERNLDDSAFVREREGEILTVLDENVFEMFIHPYDRRMQVETFYADLWSDSDKDDLALWRGFEAQAAMIAAECLIARRKPDGDNITLYMTEPHQYELAARALELREVTSRELRDRVVASRRDQRRKLELLPSILGAASTGSAVPSSVDLPAVLAADLGELRKGQVSEFAVTRLTAARLAADVLTEDRVLEPIRQLRRLLAPPIRNRIARLRPNTPLSSQDLSNIHSEAHGWHRRLVEELNRPGNANRTRRPDSRSLWNDARSIAFIRHVVLRTGSHRRILFVTGDTLLFDTYRRWHASADSSAPHYGEPFFMRRLVQYSPIFNPMDSGGDLRLSKLEGERSAALFDQMQQAVEALLLPLVSFLGSDREDGKLADGVAQGWEREQLTLRLADHAKLLDDPKLAEFAEKLGPDWASEQRQQLREIRDLWHQSHRLAIGASYDIIAPRMEGEWLEMTARLPTDGQGGDDDSLVQYASSILERLLDDTMELWRPLAETFGFDGPGGRARHPGPERLAFAIDMKAIHPRSRAHVFALAARRALELEEFGNAERFASLARRSTGDHSDTARDRPSLELQYLHALSLKFLIGTIKLNREASADSQLVARVESRIKELQAQAARLLRNCLSEHFEGWVAEAKTGPAEQSVLYLRALSELASLNLFAASSLGVALNDDPKLRYEAEYFLRLARADLQRCVREEWSLTQEGSIIGAVRSQFMHNLASAEVLAFLLSAPNKYVLPDWLRPFVKRIAALRQQRRLHPLLAAELDAFLEMAGPVARPAAGGVPRIPPPAAVSVSLPLDAELLRRIRGTNFALQT